MMNENKNTPSLKVNIILNMLYEVLIVLAPLYNYMIEKGMPVTISIVDAKKVHVLGTPEELNNFINIVTSANFTT